jgi:WW domain-binding protein 2
MLRRLRELSNSWVMLSETEGFVRLPGERILYTSPPRTTLSLQTSNTYPAALPLSISSSAGCAYLTNQRVSPAVARPLNTNKLTTGRQIVYLPASPTVELQSFSAPILNLHDTHVSAPFFGPNVWTAALQPVTGGGIPPTHPVVELKMVFKEGGAFDFHQHFERVKERLLQAIDVAREAGHGNSSTGASLAGVNLATVHLEQLPAYEEANHGLTSQPAIPPVHPRNSDDHNRKPTLPTGESQAVEERFEPPVGPPPGYEEAQAQSVGDELERRLRGSR